MMTTAALIEILREYPDDTPLLDGKGYAFKAADIRETRCDSWDNNRVDANDNLISVPVRAVAIGPRF